MSEVPGEQPQAGRAGRAQANSVIRFLEAKTGEAPRVSLRDEDSASVSTPVIDASSQEKRSVPHGRGNYQLMGEIARGGMGVVMKGHDTDLGRDIAVKVLDKRLSQRMDVVQRFVEEAQIGGQLQHPGIVPVYELGLMEDERPYFTMKLVKGRTLAALLAKRERPDAERGRLIDVFESVCQTMAYAHSRGVIHRDLKPANIMVGAFGEVQVVDWGLAKVLQRGGTADEKLEREAQTQVTILETVRSEGSGSGSESMVGSILGTPDYMPPEQASGRVDRLDERSDVFALGAILCEILTGSPPYTGTREQIISSAALAKLEGAFERLDACGADARLIEAAKQCLMAAPAARFADAGVLAERIHEYVVSNEERAHRAEVEAAKAGVRAQAERKARRLTLALGAAVVAVVLVGSGGWLWAQNERAAGQQREAQRLQAAAERDRVLGAEVGEALNAAAMFEGAQRWDEAIVAAERARALAEGGGASGELLASVEATRDELSSKLAEVRRREEFERDTQRLLSKLRQLAQPDELTGDAFKDQQYRDTFLAHGIDLDAGELEVAAGQLTRRGLGSEVALDLDAWGEVRRVAGDEPGALRLLELAHRVDPDPDRAHLREAMANRDLQELLLLASQGFTAQPASTWALLATSLVRLGEREQALAVYRAGLKQHPDDFQLHYLLASELTPGPNSEGDRDEMNEAEQHLHAVLALEPRTSVAHLYLARITEKQGDSEGALEEYARAIELEPDFGEFWFRKAQTLSRLQRYDESDALFERCAAPEQPEVMRGWALASLAYNAAARGEDGRALELARRALETRASRTYYIRIWMFASFVAITARTGDEAPLLEARERFALEFPDAESRKRFSSLLFYFAGKVGPSWSSLEVSEPGGKLLLEHACELARRGIELDPGRVGLGRTLGLASYFLGDLDAAVEALTREDELDGVDDPSIWLGLALAQLARGERALARGGYDRAVGWMAAHPEESEDEQLQWLRAEAARQLAVD